MRWRLIPWRRVYWSACLIWSCGCLFAASGAYLLPTPQLLYRSPVYGIVYRGTVPLGQVALNWRAGQWVGSDYSFPPGTATHFSVTSERSFFVVRLDDGRLLALSDRSPHLGQRVYWLPTLPGHFSGLGPGFTDTAGSIYLADGQRRAGPARRGLDPYPTVIVGTEVRIADRADCPESAWPGEWWCY